jgi:hypothetical protein
LFSNKGKSMDLSKLRAPFDPSEIEWRIGESGEKRDGGVWAKCFAYVTNRAIQHRLDEVIGPENWQCEFKEISGGFLCGIGIRSSVDGAFVWKWDGSDKTDFEATKGGISGAMKRAAVQWGIGRYLYELETGWAETSSERINGYYQAKTKGGTTFFWRPPALPGWAMPEGASQGEAKVAQEVHREEAPASQPAGRTAPPPANRGGGKPPCPSCGKKEFVLEDREIKGKFFCWKNAAKNKLGCGHKWSDGDAPVADSIKAIMQAKTTSDLLDIYATVDGDTEVKDKPKIVKMLAEKMVDTCKTEEDFQQAEDGLFQMKSAGYVKDGDDKSDYARLIRRLLDIKERTSGVGEMQGFF